MAEKETKEMKETKEQKAEEKIEQSEDKQLFTITTQNIWKITTVVLAIIVVALLFQNAKYRGTAQQDVVPTDGTQDTEGTTAPTGTIDMTLYDDDVVKGSEDAKVTIILYSDPSCPFCAAAGGGTKMVAYMQQRTPSYEAAVPGIIKNYVDTGKVKLVFRYFPGHGKGVEAMKMLLCANEQEKFWELHDVFFNNQELMEAGNTEGLADFAKELVPDTAAFDTCRQSTKYDAKLSIDTQRGSTAATGQQFGTPAFIIDGQLITGAQPYSAFSSVIDAALAE